jgi:S1-C subfamily serine protease
MNNRKRQYGDFVRSIVFSIGDIVGWRAMDSLLVATGTIKIENRYLGSVIVDNAKNPLPFLKLYDTSAAGIEVRSADKGVAVAKAHEGKSFAKAGIIKGDVLLSVRATKGAPAVEITSPEIFRRQVRRLVVHNGQGIFQIQRGGKELEVVVAF